MTAYVLIADMDYSPGKVVHVFTDKGEAEAALKAANEHCGKRPTIKREDITTESPVYQQYCVDYDAWLLAHPYPDVAGYDGFSLGEAPLNSS